MTFFEAAITVLQAAGRPLHYKKITEMAIKRGLLSHVGKTPEFTMGTRLSQEIRKDDGSALVVRTRPGVFGLRAWSDNAPIPAEAIRETIRPLADEAALEEINSLETSRSGLSVNEERRQRRAALREADAVERAAAASRASSSAALHQVSPMLECVVEALASSSVGGEGMSLRGIESAADFEAFAPSLDVDERCALLEILLRDHSVARGGRFVRASDGRFSLAPRPLGEGLREVVAAQRERVVSEIARRLEEVSVAAQLYVLSQLLERMGYVEQRMFGASTVAPMVLARAGRFANVGGEIAFVLVRAGAVDDFEGTLPTDVGGAILIGGASASQLESLVRLGVDVSTLTYAAWAGLVVEYKIGVRHVETSYVVTDSAYFNALTAGPSGP